MSKIAKVKKLIPATRSRTRLSASLSDVREDQVALQSIVKPPSSDPPCTINTSPGTSQFSPPLPLISPQDICQSLKIPDGIRYLIPYDGNPATLNDFINNVEEILLLITGTDKTPYGQFLLRAIRNKIEGKANELLISSGIGLNWDDIRETLIGKFADKRSEETLNFELHGLVHKRLPLQEFYERILDIRATYNRIIENTEIERAALKFKKESFEKTCLYTFIHGIKGPLGATVRTFKPRSLQEAFDVALKERDIFMRENWSKQTPSSRPSSSNYNGREFRRYDRPRDKRFKKKPDFDRNFRSRDQTLNHSRFRDNDRSYTKMKAIMPKEEDRKHYDKNNQYPRNYGGSGPQRQTPLNHIETGNEQELHNIDDGNFQLKARRDI